MNWDQVKSAIGQFAPALAGTLGTPVAGVAVKAICEVLGLDAAQQTPDTLSQAIVGATPDQLLAIKQADNQHAEFMAKLSVEREQVAVADRTSARERESKTGDSATPRILAGIVIVGYFAVQWFILTHSVAVDMREIVMRSMGTLDMAQGLVLGYYFGSSAGRDQAGAK